MALQDSHRYDDIICLKHPTSVKHPRMAAIDRAAQFSPFAALTGYEAATKETARVTERRRELDEQEKAALDGRLHFLWEHRQTASETTITYFVPDERKEGGAYCKATGTIHKLDAFARSIVLSNGKQIPLDEVVRVESPLLDERPEDD